MQRPPRRCASENQATRPVLVRWIALYNFARGDSAFDFAGGDSPLDGLVQCMKRVFVFHPAKPLADQDARAAGAGSALPGAGCAATASVPARLVWTSTSRRWWG